MLLALAAAADSFAQEGAAAGDSLTRRTGSKVILPVLAYTPDTSIVFGATYLRFFQLEPEFADSRSSVFSPVFLYTLNSQTMIFLGLGLNWNQNRNALDITPSYINFPDQFYGIGRTASLDDEEDYTSEQIELKVGYNRRLLGDLRLGLLYGLKKHDVTETEPGGLLDGPTLAGTGTSWVSGLGPTLALDGRDNTWAPRHGLWLQLKTRLAGTALGSDFTYQEFTLDLRGYRLVGKELVLAGQYLTTRLSGAPPFFALPKLGGESGLRGYRASLYRDRTRALLRVELRRSRLWGRLGAAAFAGIGDVAPEPGKLTLAGRLWAVGGGLRFLLDPGEQVNVRMDFGLGNGDSGFFFSLGEAF